ncbi:hypothetical protein McanMca71_005347 [Microsporum canis]|uniref:Mrsp1 n=1 Tax=Arthroderma otae (strain ATCC MYA-4605 / CBS 113480) TaxID=554155 RepID=C5G1A1_ARTOC|nr:Mrsp1 [Microsporum canis CBS 113480]EEQ28564.1 Mrsp1 [Microsporum canis CBS 113480]
MAIKISHAICLLAVSGVVSGLTTGVENDSQGKGTIYYQFGATGSCGVAHSDGDYIVALGKYHMKGAGSPNCGRHITAKNTSNGKTITVTVADTCEGCGPNDVDFALGPWQALTNNAAPGFFPVSWHWS